MKLLSSVVLENDVKIHDDEMWHADFHVEERASMGYEVKGVS